MTEAAITDAPADGPPPDAAAPAPERPEGVPDKFWDAEKGEVRVSDVISRHNDLERLIGNRVSDMPIEARRKLAEALPDALKETWASDLRTQLAADEAFLTPLEEAWKTKNLRQAPEAYEPPEVAAYLHADSELYAKAVDIAKRHGLDQDSFGELMAFVTEAQNDRELSLGGFTAEKFEAAVPDLRSRATAVHNRLVALSSEAGAKKLMEWVREPEAFLALESVVKATSPKPLALEPSAAAEPTYTQEQLRRMVDDPKYDRDSRHFDPAFREAVNKGYNKLFSDTISF